MNQQTRYSTVSRPLRGAARWVGDCVEEHCLGRRAVVSLHRELIEVVSSGIKLDSFLGMPRNGLGQLSCALVRF